MGGMRFVVVGKQLLSKSKKFKRVFNFVAGYFRGSIIKKLRLIASFIISHNNMILSLLFAVPCEQFNYQGNIVINKIFTYSFGLRLFRSSCETNINNVNIISCGFVCHEFSHLTERQYLVCNNNMHIICACMSLDRNIFTVIYSILYNFIYYTA